MYLCIYVGVYNHLNIYYNISQDRYPTCKSQNIGFVQVVHFSSISVQFQFQFYDVYSKHILFGHCDHHCKFSFIHSVHKDGISEFINSNSCFIDRIITLLIKSIIHCFLYLLTHRFIYFYIKLISILQSMTTWKTS